MRPNKIIQVILMSMIYLDILLHGAKVPNPAQSTPFVTVCFTRTYHLNSKATASLESTTVPKNIHLALECPKWKVVVMEEMRTLEKNKTWELCALPMGHKTIGCN